ncbi:hypothetical protein [Variovorax sp. UMC13]|uniref:hypothetical protein n=1 Tax=Variovorax sp. UMC13 TaxID=1862326 RepID=UPI0016017B92|nr:hypothetical protein [Variovorax sp. UMC13]MBB1601382.1 hypothetical protein [Variovorax sp. UMC13]
MWMTKTQACSALIALVLGAFAAAVCAAEGPGPQRSHGGTAAAAPALRPLAERGPAAFDSERDARPVRSIGAAAGYARLGRFRCWVAVRTYLRRQFLQAGG